MRLGRLLAIGIVAEKLSAVEAASEIGIKTKTLAAIMRGGRCDGPTLVKILAWLVQEENAQAVRAIEHPMPQVQAGGPKVPRGVMG